MTTLRTVRVAAVQATPVVLDAAGTVNKAVELIGDAASRGAELVVFTASRKPCGERRAPVFSAALGAADEATRSHAEPVYRNRADNAHRGRPAWQ